MKRRKNNWKKEYTFFAGKRRTEREKEENMMEKEKLLREGTGEWTEIEGSTRGPPGPKNDGSSFSSRI